MNLNYAIFRSQPIYTLSDLAQIGSHNKREKKAYKSNPDINMELTKNNIELVPLTEKYVKGFYNITKDYKKEHDKRMETEREDRKRSFKDMVDKSNNVVADELLFTATNDFFKTMKKEDIILWANTCMEFVYKDMGYTKDQVLHATVHMDEKTPHLHCVVVPLIKKLDKRTKTMKYTISKKQYIKDKQHLSTLQDQYHQRLVDKGFDLERGIKNSDNEHINIKEYKRITKKISNELTVKNNRLNNAMSELESKIKTNKETLFDKEYIKIKKDTFDTMNKVIKETKRVMEVQPKIEQAYSTIENYMNNYQVLEKENKNIQRELKSLKTRNSNLIKENNNLKKYLKQTLKTIKRFCRRLLQFGNKIIQEITTSEIKNYYDNEDFTKNDIREIAQETPKEKELFDYANIYSIKEQEKYEETNYDDLEL